MDLFAPLDFGLPFDESAPRLLLLPLKSTMLAFESSERTASLVESEIVLIALFADCCVLDGEKEVDADDESF